MAWAKKRTPRASTYTAYWRDEHGVQRQCGGYADKRKTEELAQRREDECGQIRDGLIDPAERTARAATGKSLGRHIDDWRAALLAQDNTPRYCQSRASTVRRLLADAAIDGLAGLTKDAILAGLAVWKGRGRSARTLNDARGGVIEFCGWLADADRIPRLPKGLSATGKYSEESDRRLVRRALTKDELAKLLTAAENGRTLTREAVALPRPKGSGRGGWGQKGRARNYAITGPERAALYRVAMGTGFRANELRTLTADCFALDGDEPEIVLKARNAKNRREVKQPITRELAAWLRGYLSSRAECAPVLVVPEKTAWLLRIDLDAAGIAYAQQRKGQAAEGVIDFHALRMTYITHLIEDGANPKVVQSLARHSTVTLTLERYTHLRDGDKRRAIQGGGD